MGGLDWSDLSGVIDEAGKAFGRYLDYQLLKTNAEAQRAYFQHQLANAQDPNHGVPVTSDGTSFSLGSGQTVTLLLIGAAVIGAVILLK